MVALKFRRWLIAAAAVLNLVLPAGAGAASEARTPRPTEHFAALPFVEAPALSPDGTKYAAKISIKGQQFLAVLSIFEQELHSRIPASDIDINWWRWVNDEWLVVGIGAMDSVEGTDFYVRRVIGVSAVTGKIVPLAFKGAAQGADVVWIAADGTPRIRLAVQRSIYLSEEGFWPEVIEIDVSTGKSKLVARSNRGVTDWYADGSGTVRIGIGYADEGRSSRLLYRDRDGTGFRVIDRASTRKGESLLVPSLFLPEAGQALAVSDHEGYDAVYKLDLTTLALGERVFGVAGFDIDGILADTTRSRLLGVAVTEDAPRIHWLDPELARLQAEFDKSVPELRPAILSMDRKRERFLVHLGGADRPGGFYFFATSDGRLQRVAHVNKHIGGGKLNPVKTVRYKARDGLEIAAVLTLPAGRDPKALPVIVMPHGGPFARDSESWDWWSQFLAERGYAVIQPNFRGSSGYGTSFAKKGEGQWGLAMQDDLIDALAYLTSQGIADPKRACIVGGSYGGYAAMRGAQRDGGHYRCAVSFAGVSDLPAMRRYDRSFLNAGAFVDWLRDQAPDLSAVSPINFAKDFSIPILLVHGKEDRRVPVRQSRQMAERLRNAGKAVRYIEQPNGDHHFSREADRLEFLQALEAFLAEHNPA